MTIMISPAPATISMIMITVLSTGPPVGVLVDVELVGSDVGAIEGVVVVGDETVVVVEG